MRPSRIALILLAVLPGCASFDPPGFALSCADGTTGRGVIGPEGLALSYAPGPAGGRAVAGLTQVPSASGVHWRGIEIDLWEKGGTAMLSTPGRTETTCTTGP